MGVEVVPSVEVGELHPAAAQQLENVVLVGVGRGPPVGLVVDDVFDGLHRVALGVTDEANRTTLDPTGRVDAVHLLVVVVENLTLAVGDHTTLLVEGDAVEGRTEVADRAVDGLDRQLADLSGSANATLAIRLGALVPEAAHTSVVTRGDLERLGEEVQMQTTRGGAGLGGAPLGEDTVENKHLLVGGDRGASSLVVVEVFFVNDHVDVAQFAELAQLQRGELHLHGSAAAEDVHVGDRG